MALRVTLTANEFYILFMTLLTFVATSDYKIMLVLKAICNFNICKITKYVVAPDQIITNFQLMRIKSLKYLSFFNLFFITNFVKKLKK